MGCRQTTTLPSTSRATCQARGMPSHKDSSDILVIFLHCANPSYQHMCGVCMLLLPCFMLWFVCALHLRRHGFGSAPCCPRCHGLASRLPLICSDLVALARSIVPSIYPSNKSRCSGYAALAAVCSLSLYASACAGGLCKFLILEHQGYLCVVLFAVL